MQKLSFNKRFPIVSSPFRWLFLGAVFIVLKLLSFLSPAMTEYLYSRGIFIMVRYLLDYTIGLFPWASIFTILIVFLVLFYLNRRKKGSREKTGPTGFRRIALIAGNVLSITFILFNLLWGFNYSRIPVEEHLKLELKVLGNDELCEEISNTGKIVSGIRERLSENEGPYEKDITKIDYEEILHGSFSEMFETMGYPSPGRVRVRLFRPGGLMLRVGISGIYNPFGGDGNVSAALTAPEFPMVMAHEMAHGYGFGDEGTCNFLGVLACMRCEDPYFAYSGWMMYWRYLAGEMAGRDPLMYLMLRRELAAGVEADLTAIRKNNEKYRGILAEAGRKVNDTYLKIQGISEGINNYNKITFMLSSFKKSQWWNKMQPD